MSERGSFVTELREQARKAEVRAIEAERALEETKKDCQKKIEAANFSATIQRGGRISELDRKLEDAYNEVGRFYKENKRQTERIRELESLLVNQVNEGGK